MKYKTAFRLLVKAVGLVLAILGLLSVLGTAVGQVASYFQGFQPMGLRIPLIYWLQPVIVPLAKTSLGVYLFFRGEWIVNLAIPSNRPYCPECSYDLSGAVETICPECGTPFRWEDIQPRGAGNSSESGSE